MPVLTINPFDEELLRLAKSTAALKGETLKTFVERTISAALGVEAPNGKPIDTGTKNLTKSTTKTKK